MRPLIVVSGHSFRDPLFSALIYRYVRGVMVTRPRRRFILFTEEHPAYEMTADEVRETKDRLETEGISWRPLRYRGGRLLVVKKLRHFVSLATHCLVARIRYRPKAIVGFLAIAGGYAYLLSLLLNLRLVVFCFEPHSRYMTDFGVWRRASIRHKLLGAFEFLQATRSDYLVVPTIHTEELVRSWRTRAKVARVPVCIDTAQFAYSAPARDRIRSSLGIGERYCLVYAGKFGGVYDGADDVAALCAELGNHIPELFILVLTPNDTALVRRSFDTHGLTPDRTAVLAEVPPEELPAYISAGDMGLLAIPPLPAQKYRTPVKTGIYLAVGIPVLLSRGVGDDDDMVQGERVGVVMAENSATGIAETARSIRSLMQEDREQLRARCQGAAYRYRDITRAVASLEQILDDLEA